jgi:hypothetical protein
VSNEAVLVEGFADFASPISRTIRRDRRGVNFEAA